MASVRRNRKREEMEESTEVPESGSPPKKRVKTKMETGAPDASSAVVLEAEEKELKTCEDGSHLTGVGPVLAAEEADAFEALPPPRQALFKHKCEYQLNDDGSVTFYPSPDLAKAEFATTALRREAFAKTRRLAVFLQSLECNGVEAMYDWGTHVVASSGKFLHGFVRATELAYFGHYPLKWKPSDVWLLILQATATHVREHSEELRGKFVTHSDKKDLVLFLPDFVKGSRDNDWDSYVDEFVALIDGNTVDDTVSLLDADFSDASRIDKLAAKVTIMDVCQHYFTYGLMGGCGFPSVTLDGTRKDWANLRAKTEKLLSTKVVSEWGKWWGASLLPVLDRFVDAFDGKLDCLFWNSVMRKAKMTSGDPIVDTGTGVSDLYSGWINVFFPYLRHAERRFGFSAVVGKGETPHKSGDRNSNCVPYSMADGYAKADDETVARPNTGIRLFPYGIASAPVTLKMLDTGEVFNLKFAAGFLGVAQDSETLCVSPKVGWFVAERS